MECLVRLETFLNSIVFLFISYWIIQNDISICRLKIVSNSVKKTAAIATKSKLISLLGWSFSFFVEVVAKCRQCYNIHLVGFWFKWAMRLQMRPYDWITCERETFLLAHRHWGKFREEERLRLRDRNSILMT